MSKCNKFQKQIASYALLIVDELGFVPLSKTGAELLFELAHHGQAGALTRCGLCRESALRG
jgi:hypothetical protein